MTAIVLIIIAAALLCPPFCILQFASGTALRVFALVVLAGFALFSVFGFLASYELPSPAERLPWQVGYALLGIVCVLGPAVLLRLRQMQGDADREDR